MVPFKTKLPGTAVTTQRLHRSTTPEASRSTPPSGGPQTVLNGNVDSTGGRNGGKASSSVPVSGQAQPGAATASNGNGGEPQRVGGSRSNVNLFASSKVKGDIPCSGGNKNDMCAPTAAAASTKQQQQQQQRHGPSEVTGPSVCDSSSPSARNDESRISLAEVAEDWVKATHRGRVASRAMREAEVSGRDTARTGGGLMIPGMTGTTEQTMERTMEQQVWVLRSRVSYDV